MNKRQAKKNLKKVEKRMLVARKRGECILVTTHPMKRIKISIWRTGKRNPRNTMRKWIKK